MHVTIEYGTQVRSASGLRAETLEVAAGTTAAALLKQLVESHATFLAPWFTDDYRPRPGLLVFINDQTPTSLETTHLRAGDQVALMTMVSGG